MEQEKAKDNIPTPLLVGEFAIKHGASYDNLIKDAKFKIKDDGTVELSLIFKITNKKDILVGPTPDVKFNMWGLFDGATSEGFKSGTINRLYIIADPDENKISFQLENLDVDLLTKGAKGEHGRQTAIKNIK